MPLSLSLCHSHIFVSKSPTHTSACLNVTGPSQPKPQVVDPHLCLNETKGVLTNSWVLSKPQEIVAHHMAYQLHLPLWGARSGQVQITYNTQLYEGRGWLVNAYPTPTSLGFFGFRGFHRLSKLWISLGFIIEAAAAFLGPLLWFSVDPSFGFFFFFCIAWIWLSWYWCCLVGRVGVGLVDFFFFFFVMGYGGGGGGCCGCVCVIVVYCRGYIILL